MMTLMRSVSCGSDLPRVFWVAEGRSSNNVQKHAEVRKTMNRVIPALLFVRSLDSNPAGRRLLIG